MARKMKTKLPTEKRTTRAPMNVGEEHQNNRDKVKIDSGNTSVLTVQLLGSINMKLSKILEVLSNG